MEKYEFYQDVQVAVWQRHRFTIEAADRGQALAMLEAFAGSEVAGSAELPFETLGNETITGTETILSPSQNRGYSTLEIYDQQDNLLFENGQTTCY